MAGNILTDLLLERNRTRKLDLRFMEFSEVRVAGLLVPRLRRQRLIQPVVGDAVEEDLRPALAVAVGPLLGGEPHVVLRAPEGLVEPFGLPTCYGVGHVVAHEGGALDLLYQPLEGLLALHE